MIKQFITLQQARKEVAEKAAAEKAAAEKAAAEIKAREEKVAAIMEEAEERTAKKEAEGEKKKQPATNFLSDPYTQNAYCMKECDENEKIVAWLRSPEQCAVLNFIKRGMNNEFVKECVDAVLNSLIPYHPLNDFLLAWENASYDQASMHYMLAFFKIYQLVKHDHPLVFDRWATIPLANMTPKEIDLCAKVVTMKYEADIDTLYRLAINLSVPNKKRCKLTDKLISLWVCMTDEKRAQLANWATNMVLPGYVRSEICMTYRKGDLLPRVEQTPGAVLTVKHDKPEPQTQYPCAKPIIAAVVEMALINAFITVRGWKKTISILCPANKTDDDLVKALPCTMVDTLAYLKTIVTTHFDVDFSITPHYTISVQNFETLENNLRDMFNAECFPHDMIEQFAEIFPGQQASATQALKRIVCRHFAALDACKTEPTWKKYSRSKVDFRETVIQRMNDANPERTTLASNHFQSF